MNDSIHKSANDCMVNLIVLLWYAHDVKEVPLISIKVHGLDWYLHWIPVWNYAAFGSKCMLQSLILQFSTTIQVHDMSKSSEKKNMLTAFPACLFSINRLSKVFPLCKSRKQGWKTHFLTQLPTCFVWSPLYSEYKIVICKGLQQSANTARMTINITITFKIQKRRAIRLLVYRNT